MADQADPTEIPRHLEVLSRAGSGYGREQMLLLALRLACRDLSGAQAEEGKPQEMEGDLMDAYLLEAEGKLSPEGDPQEAPSDDPF
jgi:hypothetical protein